MLALVANCAALHGDAFLPMVREEFQRTGTTNNLLGNLRQRQPGATLVPLSDEDWGGDIDALLDTPGPADDRVDRTGDSGPDADGADHVDCDDYRGHQRQHRYQEGRWVCDACAR